MSAADVRRAFLEFFRERGHTVVAVLQPRPGQRPDAAVHQCRHGAVQGLLPRQGQARLRARGLEPALRARRRQTQRPRERRLHRAPSHVLRDARQFLLRRLLQEGRDPLRLGFRHRHAEDRSRRASWSRSTTTDDEAVRPLEQDDRRCRREDRAHRRQARWRLRQLLADGRHRPLRSVHRDLLRSRRAHSGRHRRVRPTPTAIAGSKSGTSCSCSSTAPPTASSRRCRSLRSTPARVSSACPR